MNHAALDNVNWVNGPPDYAFSGIHVVVDVRCYKLFYCMVVRGLARQSVPIRLRKVAL